MSNDKLKLSYTGNKSPSPKLIWNESRIGLKFEGSCLKQDTTPITRNDGVSLYIAYKLDAWSRGLNTEFILKNCLLGDVELTKNTDPDKYKYSGYAFDLRSEFTLSDGSMGKNVITFGVDMSSSVHIDNKKKHIIIPGKDPTQGLDDTTVSAEVEYSIDFSRSNRKLCLSLHYNGSNSFLFVNATKIYQFKVNDSKIKNFLCI